ncbi:MAG TPA: hypothetical protein VKV95_01210 [Terriglobia bacterium]|nr:hypothetical protein [Terriglobia bacterium]
MKNPRSVSAGKKAAETRRKNEAAKHREYVRRFKEAGRSGKWAVTMAKVRIRQTVGKAPWPRWHLLTFTGPEGGEARGVVDMMAIRKDHGKPFPGTKRGDTFQIILIQVKGGSAARPTDDDRDRLRKVAQRHDACGILLATWKKGKSANFFFLAPKATSAKKDDWQEVSDLADVFA